MAAGILRVARAERSSIPSNAATDFAASGFDRSSYSPILGDRPHHRAPVAAHGCAGPPRGKNFQAPVPFVTQLRCPSHRTACKIGWRRWRLNCESVRTFTFSSALSGNGRSCPECANRACRRVRLGVKPYDHRQETRSEVKKIGPRHGRGPIAWTAVESKSKCVVTLAILA